MKKKLLKVSGLCKRFETVDAVNNLHLDILEGETLGLVGESGSGKSTFGRIISSICEKDSGEISYDGIELEKISEIDRAKKIQMIFQDPYASLNPRMLVGEIVAEGLDIHKLYKTNKEREEMIESLLLKVGLSNEDMSRFSHEFSGGQRQRIGIARALAINPEFVVCDEPISSLDVSIQAQIVNLLKELQKKEKLTYLFISHDLNVVRYISDRIAVMYKGRIVELAESDELYNNPMHPYTVALISAMPKLEMEKFKTDKLELQECNKVKCQFDKHCQKTMHQCTPDNPNLIEVTPGHFVTCHF